MLRALAVLGPCCSLWYVLGALSTRIGAPSITGIILAGALTGPSVLDVLSKTHSQALLPIEHACLAVIALAAGLELSWDDIAPKQHQVLWVTAGVILGSWIAVFAAVLLVFPAVALALPALQTAPLLAAACLAATLALARSPASAVRLLVRGELESGIARHNE